MSYLPRISGRQCVKALQKSGFIISRQSGSHIIMRRDNPYGKVVVPNHNQISKGTLRAIIRDANPTVDEFIALHNQP
ncbi:MAG: type II toxin-antitoxin system HicA family toxin [Anaerolineae bacterium]|nr:type II toxin-antitoxin system HicA family toxin [Anaerolineae bacterium]